MTNSADPDQLASSEANGSGSALFAKTGHVLFSMRRINAVQHMSTKVWILDQICVVHVYVSHISHMLLVLFSQIMMCCVYGICKVSEKEIKFKDIVTAYRTLPFSEAYVCHFISCRNRMLYISCSRRQAHGCHFVK